MEHIQLAHNRRPERIQVDNDSEFISKALENGRIKIMLCWTSPDLAHQPTIHLLNRLMVASEMNV